MNQGNLMCVLGDIKQIAGCGDLDLGSVHYTAVTRHFNLSVTKVCKTAF